MVSNYDLVLVVEFFRSLTFYLSIIKYLGKEYRIGLYPVPFDEKFLEKHTNTQEEFIRKCEELGAEVIDKKPVVTKVLLIPQRPYLKETLNDIRQNIRAVHTVGALTLAWPGLHDGFLEYFSIKKVFVVHQRFLDFLLDHRGDKSNYAKRELVEVGLPFKKYPVFSEFEADYLMAMPTPFSFPHEHDKWYFLETTLSLFNHIEPTATVAYKPHNGMERDYFSPSNYKVLIRWITSIPGLNSFLKNCSAFAPLEKLRRYLEKLYTAYLYEKIMERTVPMDRLTPFHNFGMEAFLPGVRRGVIGGLSNTIWGALFHKLPFYNCVDITRQRRDAKDKLYGKKDPSQFLDLNLKFFLVPYCEGRLEFDSKYFDIVDETTRQGDLIEELRKEINTVKQTFIPGTDKIKQLLS